MALKIKFKRLLPKLLLIFVGTIIAFIILEILLRITEKKTYDYGPCTSQDKNFHHVMITNSQCRYKTDEWDVMYKFNSLGLRDDEIPIKKPENEFRILVLGDSFTQTHGVDEDKGFVNVLEKKLNDANYKKKIQVINSGVFAYSPLVEYLYLKEKGLDFAPDMVILAFDTTDFWDDRQRFAELKQSYPDLPDEEIWPKIKNGTAEFLFEKINTAAGINTGQQPSKSKTAFLVKQWLRKNIRIYKTLADFKKKKNPIIQQDAIYKGDIDRDLMAITRGPDISDENWQKLWELPMYNLELMENLTKENNISFIIVAIPDFSEVSPEQSPYKKAFGFPDNYVDPRGPFQNEMAKRLDAMSIPFINLLQGFRESRLFPLYFKKDMHFNENGQILAGELIYKELKPQVDKLLAN